MTEMTTLIKDAMLTEGIKPPETILIDGEIHRFDISKSGDKVGWYVFYNDGTPAGAFGDWREGITHRWCAKSGREVNPLELKQQDIWIRDYRLKQKNERRRQQAVVQRRAQALWTSGTDRITHPYQDDKQIFAYGARQYQQRLLIPLYFRGEFWNLQQIFPGGEKRFLKGGRVKGCYCRLGEPAGHLYICEGFATGCSLHEHIGDAVIVAFNAGNLKSVALEIQRQYPEIKITIAADNDSETRGNPGITKAREAAALVGADLIYPDFSGLGQSGTDFNDYVNAGGKL